jgi:hypothetical protein
MVALAQRTVTRPATPINTIALGVAHRVVDNLEPSREEQYGELPFVAVSLSQSSGNAVLEKRPVGKTRQRVMIRQI